MSAPSRIDWVDVGKGFCIFFVVMMHATLGVQADTGTNGWMNAVVEFAAPFRMPDFFLIAGLFLARTIDRPWATYLDRKVLHFFYFYVIWVTIQFAFKAPGFVGEYGLMGAAHMYLMAYVEPFGTLWFIYILPIFFVITKILRPISIWAVLALGAALEVSNIHTGHLLIDETAARFVYFFAGYALATHIFSLAEWVRRNKLLSCVLLVAWAAVNGSFVYAGLDDTPYISLFLGAIGAMAVVSFSVLVVGTFIGETLRYGGERSIVVYLAFFLPMAITREVLLMTGIISDVGTISLVVTVAAVVGPLIGYAILKRLGIFEFLFDRPNWARLPVRDPKKQMATAKA